MDSTGTVHLKSKKIVSSPLLDVEVGCWSNPAEFCSCPNKAYWITKASRREEEG